MGEGRSFGMDVWMNLLVCPKCSGGLLLESFEWDDHGLCREGVLTCRVCRQWYPITHGVPRLFLPGPLRPDDRPFLARWGDRFERPASTLDKVDQPVTGDLTQVQATFGYKWTRLNRWRMAGESARLVEEWLLPRYGWQDQSAYEAFMLTRSRMLDAGCGLGRESFRMARANPRALVIGLELSECVDEAIGYARKHGVANAFFVQGDLRVLPLKHASFDFILSEGVLHHTEDTQKALSALIPLLAPGGEIAFYVYRRKAPLREYADDFVRSLLQDLTPAEAWNTMESLTRLAKALSDLKVEIDVPEDVPVLGIRTGRYDIQRLIYYTMFKCYWNDRLSFEENVQVNFDWYAPRYSWRHTQEEVQGWIAGAGLRTMHETVDESGITVRAELPMSRPRVMP